jgi:glycine dehydrogenase subunit 2
MPKTTAVDPTAQTANAANDYALIETGYQAVRWHEPVIYKRSRPGLWNEIVGEAEPEVTASTGDVLSSIPAQMRRKAPPALPELSEPEVVRHYLRLSQETYGFDSGISIGSGTCTMKYSPKVNERLSRLPGIAQAHPLQPEETIQGILEIMYNLRNWLCELAGMDEFTFQPRGGAHGIYANAAIMRAYHRARGDTHRDEVITCVVSHPADAGCPAAAGFKVVTLYPDRETGDIGIEALKAAVSERTAGFMFTIPYDTGVFDSQIGEYIKVVHEAGGLVALDQANFNGVMTRLRAGDIGADMMQFNLHKSFSTPHGSYGPATGAVGVKAHLRPFLPVPVVEFDGSAYHLNYDLPDSIGGVGGFYGVVMNTLKAYAWIMAMGQDGLREAAEWAVLNNNYLIKKLLEIPGVGIAWPNRRKLQEARFHLQQFKAETGIGSAAINNRFADYGLQTFFTSHEPMIIDEPITPEASDTVSKADIEQFAEAMRCVLDEARTNPDIIATAPHRCSVDRSDEMHSLDDYATATMTWRQHLRKMRRD